ncbi:hypothetical protein [Pantoea sp. CTOTU50773]|uniref:hypothetical protein n=1 Tax=Pantoea sp. CTOTU50773 TaxID=2953853 RepID=UPI0028B11690|nr:hypothetical protein [Pantoea sp. CTOTU50773]
MDIIQGKEAFNEMATGVMVKLFTDYPTHTTFEFSDLGWSPRKPNRQVDLLIDTLNSLEELGHVKILSRTDMDYTAKLSPSGLSILNRQALGSKETVINVLNAVAGEARGAAISSMVGAAINRIFSGGK